MWPERFASIHHARNILDAFTSWYNDEHRDTGIGLHAPADVHFGLAGQKATERAVVLAQARAQHPERSGGPSSQRSWTYLSTSGSTSPRPNPMPIGPRVTLVGLNRIDTFRTAYLPRRMNGW